MWPWAYTMRSMSITPEASAKTLTQMVATRIRVAMAVEDIRQAELSRRMNKNEQWLSVRLRGRQPIDMNDLLQFARALGVGIHDLMPTAEEAAEAADAIDPRNNSKYPDLPERPTVDVTRPRDNRPNGRPLVAAARTAYVERPGRRRRDR
jgi:transcriptional regulator with XRE-family HTH domain